MSGEIKFEVMTGVASQHYAYKKRRILTLGVDITDEHAKDLLRAGHIRKVDATEQTTVKPAETSAKAPVATPRVTPPRIVKPAKPAVTPVVDETPIAEPTSTLPPLEADVPSVK